MEDIEHADHAQHQHGPSPGMHPSFLKVLQQKQRIKQKLTKVKRRIGVYSAKGGVGKTTIAVNLAFSLMKKGFKVGLLDADIDCPNVTVFLGMEDSKMEPVMPLKPLEKDGVKVASTAMLVDELKRPIIWRGPLVAKMISDFLENTDWGELDYLVVDLPPGTSDSPLSIMQLLDLDGFVIVTNPQRIAALNSIRSGLMAKRMNAPILGVVENMSNGKPSKNTENVVSTLQTELLGTVRARPEVAELTDRGVVHVLSNKEVGKEFDVIIGRITSADGKV